MPYKIEKKECLEKFITGNWNKINEYIDKKMEGLPVPLYSSVDVRESKFKFAPVDHNMYPAGFNNLCQLDLDAAGIKLGQAICKHLPNVKSIAIIPESHTKNLYYLDHLAYLGKTIRDAGHNVYYVSLDTSIFEEGQESLKLLSHSKFDIEIHHGKINDGKIIVNDNIVDFAILNNDQSSPLDVDWKAITTPIHPTPYIGWFKREKIKHFSFYRQVANEFCNEFDIKPCLVQALFRNESDVDFSSKEGLEDLAKEVDELLSELDPNSKVFVKASQGTYGMGITVVSSGDEVLSMNRKARNKMDIGKNKIKFTSAIIQEGIESILKYDDMPAEVAIYLVNGQPVGGFVRANSLKDSQSNLNAKGMVFRRYCISEIRENNDGQAKEAVYSILARLSTLASAYEIKEVL
jgi:glutamate--cysteine ligase